MNRTVLLTIALGLSAIRCANIRGGLTGVVKDESGQPVADAKVSIYDMKKEKVVYDIQTGTDGRFEYYETNLVIFNGYCGPSLRIAVTKSQFESIEKEFKWLCRLEKYFPVLRSVK